MAQQQASLAVHITSVQLLPMNLHAWPAYQTAGETLSEATALETDKRPKAHFVTSPKFQKRKLACLLASKIYNSFVSANENMTALLTTIPIFILCFWAAMLSFSELSKNMQPDYNCHNVRAKFGVNRLRKSLETLAGSQEKRNRKSNPAEKCNTTEILEHCITETKQQCNRAYKPN